MKKLIMLLISCALSSCSFTGNVYNGLGISKVDRAARLYTIRIEQWGELRFSGILALQQRQEGLYYVMLDATGVKLIEAEVGLTGDHRLIRANGPLESSQLPHYLSTSLKRIYLLDPQDSPCSRNVLLWFCKELSGEKGWKKYVQAGPFTVWRVEKNERDEDKSEIIVYSQPWLGVRIVLKGLDKDKTG